MRTQANDLALWASRRFDVHGRLLIDGIPLADLLGSNPLITATWTAADDQLVASGQITLARLVNGTNLSPFMSNTLGDAQPFPGKLFELQTANTTKGVEPGDGDFLTVFSGEIDSVDVAGESLLLDCRDDMAFYADRIIEPPMGDIYGYPVTGGTMESVLQSLATVWDSFTDPLGINAPGVVVVGDPEWTVSDYYQEAGMSIAEAMHAVVLQRGWALHSRYNSLQGRGIPTAYDPIRLGGVKPPQFLYFLDNIGEVIRYQRLRVDRVRVRNVIELQYGDTRSRLSVEDTESIAAYGRRYMLLSEHATSRIDTEVEAGRMLEGALADLKDAQVLLDYERLYMSGVELADTHSFPFSEFSGSQRHSQIGQGVVGYTHSLDWRPEGQFRSIIRTATLPRAASGRWRKTDQQMVHVATDEPVGMAPEHAVWYQVESLE